MTIAEINERIIEIQQQQTEHYRAWSRLLEEEEQLQQLRVKYLIENKLYSSFPLPQEMIGKDIESLVFINEDGTFEELEYGDIFEVDENGYPYFSDYERGIIEHNSVFDKWYKHYYLHTTEKNYIGYIDLKFVDKKDDHIE